MFQRVTSSFRQAVTDFEIDGDRISLSIPLAKCETTKRIVYIKSSLIAVFDPEIPSGFFHEIGFSVETIDLYDPDNSMETYDRNAAAAIIPPVLRAEALELAKIGYEALVRKINPRVIYRAVCFDGPNPDAMKKHESLTDVLENLGYYIIDSGFTEDDRWFWLMERV